MECVLLLLLLLLPLCSGGNSEFQGRVKTYYHLETHSDGTVTMAFCSKSNSESCVIHEDGCPADGCFTITASDTRIDYSPEGFCQMNSIWIRRASSSAPFKMQLYTGYQWSSPIVNGVVTASDSLLIELRDRSDTGQANRCPQTTILPVFRVPWNCPRDIRLLSFDPDGDMVQCRYANNSIDPSECAQCTPPSVLSLSPSCTLSFSASGSSSQGRYAMQLVMEDFPRTQIVLTQTNGPQEVKGTSTSISKISVQFLFLVESAAPSCSSGLYLPRFVMPTPEHGTQINVPVHETLRIHIKAQASKAMVSELLFSGPSRMTETGSGGQYVLSWTPVDVELGQSHPVCFSAQAILNTATFSSELRCVIVNVVKVNSRWQYLKVFQKVWMSSSAPLSEEAARTALLERIKMELVKRGLSVNITVSLVNGILTVRPAKSPGGVCPDL